MTDCTDTGDRVTLRGKRKKRMRQQRKRHAAIETHMYSFLKCNKNNTQILRALSKKNGATITNKYMCKLTSSASKLHFTYIMHACCSLICSKGHTHTHSGDVCGSFALVKVTILHYTHVLFSITK